MNSVLDWYFYGMHDEYVQRPEWWLRNSETGKPVYESGDKTFNPPKEGMLIFDHAKEAVRSFWQATCRKAVQTGVVDGCFSDSSQPGTHKTETQLNKTAFLVGAGDYSYFGSGKWITASLEEV